MPDPCDGWRARAAFAPAELRRGTSTHAPSRHSSRGRVEREGSASDGGWRARQDSNLRPPA